MADIFAEELPGLRQKIVSDYQGLRRTVQQRWGVVLPRLAALQTDIAKQAAFERASR